MTDITKTYAPFFKSWPVKQVGAKPTVDMLAAVHGLGLRPGKQALANAMALRDGGVSGAQIVMVCGAPQLNRMRGLIADGHVKRLPAAANEQGHTVYVLKLTPKGEARIKRASEAASKAAVPGDADKPAKPAKPASKPRKAKAAKVRAVAGDTVGKAVPVNTGDGNPFDGTPLADNPAAPQT